MDSLTPDITSAVLLKKLQSLTPAKKFLLAYSGGLDSHVLLHLMSQIPDSEIKVRAMHIHHGLQKEADDWINHCQKICDDLGVPLDVNKLGLKIKPGESLEELARKERYKALNASLNVDEVLLTAHHQNDQAETLLLQLFRGAGVQGLAAMPGIREFGSKDRLRQHVRPLLSQTRQFLETYANLHQLNYIEDPSNMDHGFDRNFLRQNIMPQLRQRWTGIDKTISRSASIQAETLEILEQVAENELGTISSKSKNAIYIPELIKHSKAKQKLLLRHWITKSGFVNPPDIKLKHVFSDVIHASEDSQPLIEWQGAQIRRFKDKLYLLAPLSEHQASAIIPWNGDKPLEIPSLNMTLVLDDFPHGMQDVTVRFRQGGEKINIPQRGSISLKNLMQESGVPPWLRSRLPLIYAGDNLLKVIGLDNY